MNIDFQHVTFFTYLAVFGAGLLTSFTPCVYPIIPIVVGFLGTRTGSFARRLTASLAYVLGLALVYTALGMGAALTGSLFGSFTTNPWVYLVFGIFLLFLGGSMMEWYGIPLLGGFGAGAGGGALSESRFLGPLLVGASSGLVASPCTAPVLGTLLVYVAASKSVVSGGLLLLSFSLGMSTLLLVFGLFAGLANLLPRSGGWMNTIKRVLAVLVIGAGIYFIFKAGTLA
jgi:cytochrome c-type biogenesis protein